MVNDLCRKNNKPCVESLSKIAFVETVVGRFEGEREPRIGVGRRLVLVIDVNDLSVGQNFSVPSEGKRSGYSLLPARSRMGPLRHSSVAVGVVNFTFWKNILFVYFNVFF